MIRELVSDLYDSSRGRGRPSKPPRPHSLGAVSTIQYRQVEIPAGMIDLGLGQPDPTVFPLAILARAASTCLAPGAEQHPRAALARQVRAGAVHWINLPNRT